MSRVEGSPVFATRIATPQQGGNMKCFAIIAAVLAVSGGIAMTAAAERRDAARPVVVAQADKPVAAAGSDASNAAAIRDNPGFYVGESGLNPSERAGREIWYKATAGNRRIADLCSLLPKSTNQIGRAHV